jgi:hypothetical protein
MKALIFLLLIPFLLLPAFAQSEFDYIVFKDGSLTKALNTKTGVIDYSSTDAASVLQSAGLAKYPQITTIYVKAGSYNFNTPLQAWNNFYLEGAGIDQTVFKRNFNQTYTHTIGITALYNGIDGYAVLKGFTIDGNYPHVDNLQDEIALTGRGMIQDVKVKNFNAMGIQLVGNVTLNNVSIIGVNSKTHGSTMGVWTSQDSRVIISDSYFAYMRIPAILASGDIVIRNSVFERNHLQEAGTGGGQIAVGKSAIIAGNIIQNGNSVTSGIETNAGNYIITENIITGNWFGVVTNGNPSTVIVSNNYLRGNITPIGQVGQAVFYLSNNIQ